MMLASMTGFVRHDTHGQWGTLHWEMRCVNNRYFDPHFHLAHQFAGLEPLLRERLQAQLIRGRCDIYLRYLPATLENQGMINMALAQQLLTRLQTLGEMTALPLHCNGLDLLRWPGILHDDTVLSPEEQQWALASFQTAVQLLSEDRYREGEKLRQVMQARLEMMTQEFAAIRTRLPALLPALQARIHGLLQPIAGELHHERLEQEMVYLAHRLDVAEECDRLHAHVEEFQRRLHEGGAVGRRLDFLLQEMQREINTLGNKANDKIINQHTVEMKVLLEQIREQVQNVV